MFSLIKLHSFMVIYISMSFVLTFLFYAIPEFINEHFIIQRKINLGTIFGTMVHKNYGHFFGNLLILVPLWIYSDKVLGNGFTLLLVLMNMLITGVLVFLFDGYCCGASGINHMLLGIMAIMGNPLVFIFAGCMLFFELQMIKENDYTAHGVHIGWQIAGTVMAVLYCIFR